MLPPAPTTGREYGPALGHAWEAAARLDPGRAVSTSFRSALIEWERRSRRAFLGSYVAECRRSGVAILPEADDDARQAIAAWELDKALYEVRYELSHRPQWVNLPLAAVLKFAQI